MYYIYCCEKVCLFLVFVFFLYICATYMLQIIKENSVLHRDNLGFILNRSVTLIESL